MALSNYSIQKRYKKKKLILKSFKDRKPLSLSVKVEGTDKRIAKRGSLT